jgi:hypothetical protein
MDALYIKRVSFHLTSSTKDKEFIGSLTPTLVTSDLIKAVLQIRLLHGILCHTVKRTIPST